MAKKLIMDENFFEGLKIFLQEHNKVAIGNGTPTAVVKELIKGAFQYVGYKLGEEKSKTEEVVIEYPELIAFKCNYRESSEGDNGSFNPGVVLGSEFKKFLKGDDLIDSDDEEDDEDEDNE